MKRFMHIALLCVHFFAPLSSNAEGERKEYALPHISVANVREEPRHGSEMSTQALMGTPVKLLAPTDNGWWKVELPDGYHGYIIGNSLTLLDDAAMESWKKSPREMVTVMHEVRLVADTVGRRPVTDLVAGDILELEEATDRWKKLRLPDGREGWLRSELLTPLSDVKPGSDAGSRIVGAAVGLMGTPYLWGGMSSKGADCSGLVRVAYGNIGIILPRDASQQAKVGKEVKAGEYREGDLAFFAGPSGRVNHVAIIIRGDSVIESAGRVKNNRLRDMDGFVGVRRMLGTSAIVTVVGNPLYFSVEESAED